MLRIGLVVSGFFECLNTLITGILRLETRWHQGRQERSNFQSIPILGLKLAVHTTYPYLVLYCIRAWMFTGVAAIHPVQCWRRHTVSCILYKPSELICALLRPRPLQDRKDLSGPVMSPVHGISYTYTKVLPMMYPLLEPCVGGRDELWLKNG